MVLRRSRMCVLAYASGFRRSRARGFPSASTPIAAVVFVGRFLISTWQ